MSDPYEKYMPRVDLPDLPETYVERANDGWYFELRRRGQVVDEAGPFDDEYDAEMAADRAVKHFNSTATSHCRRYTIPNPVPMC